MPPDDCGTSFSESAVQWLAQFYLDIPTAIKRGVVYSPQWDQIVYQLGNVWQARNLRTHKANGDKLQKNFTQGNVNEYTHIYGCNSDLWSNGRTREQRTSLVLVEDPVSAIRVADLQDAMPLLGSHLATSRLNALAGLYSGLVVWLDSDKLKEARDMARRAQLIGMDVRVIFTELDPKCYTCEQLMEILK